MSLRLALLNGFLRLTVKPMLRRVASPERARRQLEASAARMRPLLRKMRYSGESVDGPGGAIPVEWVARREGSERRRIVLYLHGGAYIMGSPRTHRSITAGLASRLDARILVPDYRLAPEHPAPAAVADALAVYTALLRQGYESDRIAFAGDSAGGGLCLALLLHATANGFPPPACLSLYSPWADLTMRAESLSRNAQADPMLPVNRFREVADYYRGEMPAQDPLVSPIFGDFDAPPPTQIFVGRSEILHDDSAHLAEALRRVGGEVALVEVDGVPHAWPFFAPIVPEGRAALDRSAAFIARHLP